MTTLCGVTTLWERVVCSIYRTYSVYYPIYNFRFFFQFGCDGQRFGSNCTSQSLLIFYIQQSVLLLQNDYLHKMKPKRKLEENITMLIMNHSGSFLLTGQENFYLRNSY